ncbi:MAG TPA: YfiR family protein, partial [Candidatus Binatia bacterium]|nr:YfiR family protein [Candidatus Binatia bacterium]
KERAAIGGKKSGPHRRSLRRAAILLLGCWVAYGFPARAQNTGPTEYQIKAAFLYNFVKFVEWPTQAYAGSTSPTVIGVLGENAFGGELEKALRNKVINHHPLRFKKLDSVTEATNCQVLFISASERSRFPQILETLRGKSVLTVSESAHFIPDGGMINFILVDRKVRFQINNGAARQAGLIISSDLLNLAVPAG